MLHQYSWSPAWIRFIYASVCGACVVSEPMVDDKPFQAGIHYAQAAIDAMPVVIEELLKNEPERTRLVRSAEELCRTTLTLQRSVEAIKRIVTQS